MNSIPFFAKLTSVLFLGVIFVIFVTKKTKDQKRYKNVSLGVQRENSTRMQTYKIKMTHGYTIYIFQLKQTEIERFRLQVKHSLIFFKTK